MEGGKPQALEICAGGEDSEDSRTDPQRNKFQAERIQQSCGGVGEKINQHQWALVAR
jgi:hypothetical protein